MSQEANPPTVSDGEAIVFFISTSLCIALATWWFVSPPPPEPPSVVERDVLRKLGIDGMLHDRIRDLSERLASAEIDLRFAEHDCSALKRKNDELRRQLQECRGECK